MIFLQLDIFAENHLLDEIALFIESQGVNGVSIYDSDEIANLMADKTANWDYLDESLIKAGKDKRQSSVTCYLASDSQGMNQLCAILSAFPACKNQVSVIREEDWANNWKAYFKPFAVGKRLMIKPTWENLEGSESNPVILEIDPASAFGTGQHETTKLCLEFLDELVTTETEHILDLGTGSGILAAAGLLLGAKSAVLCDISENSVTVACENLRQNHIADAAFHAFVGDITADTSLLNHITGISAKYDIITANIVADVIIAMAPLFADLLAKTGVLIVSGIIAERAGEVTGVLEQNRLKITETRIDNGWAAMLLSRD
jgi:ribosomal protein L11 methyltransferase